ncbi:hypothetical protein SEA_ZETA1847_24 [Microbacterium phage Zeta1847]|uniref:Uncharacterized protein n=1 Tax=Microbacterium phage Zeta1847 TaxID=2201444 RepID=A0A2Z4QAV4_9CAUD|nr:hypothetical protein HOT46_gp24 [Microbacterium phage Zeta1847]AWY06658.1 hypothetical protein SEA_ZETA1847_24 [Microbacterium phage Zeta1847]
MTPLELLGLHLYLLTLSNVLSVAAVALIVAVASLRRR